MAVISGIGIKTPRKVKRIAGLFLSAIAIAAFLAIAEPSLIVNGLLLGMTIALGAIGIALIYSILRFPHIAHGDFITLGAYVTFFLVTTAYPLVGLQGAGLGPFTFGYPLLLALPLTMISLAALAIGLDFAVYRRLRARGMPPVIMAMASLGIAIAIRGVVQIIWGTQPEQYPRVSRAFYQLPLDIRIPPDNLFLGATALVLVAGLYLFLTYTKAGKAMRATSDNPDLARISGIDTQNVIRWTWALAASYAAVAGTLFAMSQAQLLPILGWKILIPLFAGVILGGIGNPSGALIGALIIGVSTEVSTQWVSPAYKPAIAFAIMLIILTIRPTGILRGIF